ncbi:MAG: DUF1015 domain-containing protein [Lachnospiraceae bacterium]|nr:DUF1015 domain-containing protein [Lachnospiraceae bacterium]
MATVKPFCAIRPRQDIAARVAALPYDVYNRAEAKAETLREPMSFLCIDRAETQLPDDVDTYDPKVYDKARSLMRKRIDDNTFVQDATECYYVYELVMDGRSQTGVVGCASIDDYISGRIKKHENTREDKEIDRINHVDALSAQTGPIFLAYRKRDDIRKVLDAIKAEKALYDFTSPDGITHRVWALRKDKDIDTIRAAFADTDSIYIADGHHRCASAVKVGLKRRQEHPDYNGDEEFNYFLSVLFADDELMIMDYNRVIKDLNGHSVKDVLDELARLGTLTEKNGAYRPEEKGCVGVYADGKWYEFKFDEKLMSDDPVAGLDVSILQENVLGPLFGIVDPRTDTRIDFVGGIRGLQELERRVATDCKIAFAMYPTGIDELFAVADAGLLMPPKSTWFEPKLRSGLFIHEFER